jgi:DNA-binding NtrC family response regulator
MLSENVKNPLSILLVDDDAGYVDVVRHHLNAYPHCKFDISWVNAGDKAIEILKSGKTFELILMDYFLPVGTGIDVAKEIASAGYGIPILLVTSNKDFRIAIEAMKYGVEDYLIKDDHVAVLLPRTIINILEKHQLNLQLEKAEKAERMAREKNEAVGELVVTMCHEFNNPLAAIKISTDILLRSKMSDDDRQILVKLNKNIASLEAQIVKLRDLNVDQQSAS